MSGAELRRSAIAAAHAAGEIQRGRLGSRLEIESKGAADITTDVDRACEAAIVELVRARHPDHDLLGEEGTTSDGGSPYLWIIDPLDGTRNFTHGYRRFCVSIALAHQGNVVLGVVFDAVADELFVAEAGQGATLNDRPIGVSGVVSLGSAMVASALARDGRATDRRQLERLAGVFEASEAVRCDGCAALDLCAVACGRLDAYFETGLQPWDTAAGALIVAEAGGRVSTFAGQPHDLHGAETLASNGHIHLALARLL